MKKPKPIKLGHNPTASIHLSVPNKMRNSATIWMQSSRGILGYVQHKDLRRLKRWIEVCLGEVK